MIWIVLFGCHLVANSLTVLLSVQWRSEFKVESHCTRFADAWRIVWSANVERCLEEYVDRYHCRPPEPEWHMQKGFRLFRPCWVTVSGEDTLQVWYSTTAPLVLTILVPGAEDDFEDRSCQLDCILYLKIVFWYHRGRPGGLVLYL